MDEENKKPGTSQIPLINDLIFDQSLPLRFPRKKAPATSKTIVEERIPPGYDPDTGDLFGELDKPGQTPGEAEQARGTARTGEQSRRLCREVAGELESLLRSLDSPPKHSR